jgi:uncharacterized SAM-binding protein YcdF (DUF218 family)
MFFIFSKILFFLLSPATWIGLLLLLILFSNNSKLKRKLTVTIIAILVLFTNPFLYRNAVMLWQTSPVELNNTTVYEAGILLGGFSGYDKYSRGFFNRASDRFIEATSLYHQGIIKKIIITGGNGALTIEQPAESVFVSDQLLKNGIPKEAIVLESNSRNTYENALFTKRMVDSMQLKGTLVLITSAEHMPRSIKVFKKAGFTIQPYPCDYNVYNERLSLSNTIAPDPSLLEDWKYLFKEIVGTIVYQLTGKA